LTQTEKNLARGFNQQKARVFDCGKTGMNANGAKGSAIEGNFAPFRDFGIRGRNKQTVIRLRANVFYEIAFLVIAKIHHQYLDCFVKKFDSLIPNMCLCGLED
jgi:hypothetical protein